jgi:hypothetical protein|tara:strand:- start:1746 stop:2096 length:351 start_codon:yes stop_codon:yes gene_type:complete
LQRDGEEMGLVTLYQQCLIMAPLPTQATTVGTVWAMGDVVQQLIESRSRPVDYKRTWKMFFTGLGSGAIWACYHDASEEIVSSRPGGLIKHTAMYAAVQRLVSSWKHQRTAHETRE